MHPCGPSGGPAQRADAAELLPDPEGGARGRAQAPEPLLALIREPATAARAPNAPSTRYRQPARRPHSSLGQVKSTTCCRRSGRPSAGEQSPPARPRTCRPDLDRADEGEGCPRRRRRRRHDRGKASSPRPPSCNNPALQAGGPRRTRRPPLSSGADHSLNPSKSTGNIDRQTGPCTRRRRAHSGCSSADDIFPPYFTTDAERRRRSSVIRLRRRCRRRLRPATRGGRLITVVSVTGAPIVQ